MQKYLLSALALAVGSVANTSLANDVKDEIIVSAKNLQTQNSVLGSVDVFTQTDILASQADDLPALLDQLSGVNFTESGGRGSATSMFIRGVSNSQIIVLIDGVRVGSATLGAAALNTYPIEAIDRIEVLKGPFSGIYGADAVGGVIQLFTKKGGESTATIMATAGSDALREISLGLNGKGERYRFHIAAQSEETDGIDRTSIVSDGNQDLDGYEETSFSFGGEYQVSDNTAASLSVLASDNTVDFDNTFGADPGSFTDNETRNASLALTTKFDSGLTWATTLGKNKEAAVTTASFSSDFTTDRESFGSEIGLELAADTYLTIGVDYYEESVSSSTTVFPVSERDNKAIYTQITSQLGRASLAASLRYDDNSAYGSDTNGSVAFGFKLAEDLRLSATYGTAFVAPSFNFLYFPFFGNPDLLPEESDNIELSLAGDFDLFKWRVTAYQTDIENLFSFDPNTFLAANVGSAEIEGIELNATTEIAGWNLELNADVLSAINQDTGIELDDRAERTVRLMANKDWGDLNLRFDLKNESDRFDNSGTEIASYTLLNLGVQYAFTSSVSMLASVDNVFDKDYTLNLLGSNERYRTQGRQAKVSLRITF